MHLGASHAYSGDYLTSHSISIKIFVFPEVRKMRAFELFLLGSPQIYHMGRPWPIARRQARALLYALAVDKAVWTQAQLCLLFWADAPDAQVRCACSHLLTHLRRALPDPDLLQTTKEQVWLHENVWVDTVMLVRRSAGGLNDWSAAIDDGGDSWKGRICPRLPRMRCECCRSASVGDEPRSSFCNAWCRPRPVTCRGPSPTPGVICL